MERNVVSERKLRPLSDCRMKCRGKIPQTLQETIFRSYWSVGTYNQRNSYILSLIHIRDRKSETLQKHPINPRERKFQAAYHVGYEGQRVQVCLKWFQKCFDGSSSFVKTMLRRKLNFAEFDLRDHRGSGAGKNKFKDDAIERTILTVFLTTKVTKQEEIQMYKLYC